MLHILVAYSFPTIVSLSLCVLHFNVPFSSYKLHFPPAVEHCAILFMSGTGTHTNSLPLSPFVLSGPCITRPFEIMFSVSSIVNPSGTVAFSPLLST